MLMVGVVGHKSHRDVGEMKMKMKTMLMAGLFAGVMAYPSIANAVLIDFTTSGWLGANSAINSGAGTGFGDPDAGDVTVKAYNVNGAKTGVGIATGILNADDISNAGKLILPCIDVGLACDKDGIGIRQEGNNDDEISRLNGGEILRVSFENKVDILAIGVLDLFAPDSENLETASWSIGNLTPKGSLLGTASNANGFVEVTDLINLVSVSFIDFFVAAGSNFNSDFALAYLRVAPAGTINVVPLPGSVYLFGTGLLGLGFMARRRRKKSQAQLA